MNGKKRGPKIRFDRLKELFKKQGFLSSKEATELFNEQEKRSHSELRRSQRTIQRYINTLLDDGVLTQISLGSYQKYKLTEGTENEKEKLTLYLLKREEQILSKLVNNLILVTQKINEIIEKILSKKVSE